MAASFLSWPFILQVLFLVIDVCFHRVSSQVPPPSSTVVTESTVLIQNFFIQKYFAYDVKIYAFPDNLGGAGLDSAEFEQCDSDLPEGAESKDIGFAVGTKGKVLSLPYEPKSCQKKESGRSGVFRVTLTANSQTEDILAIVNLDSDPKPVSPVTQTISQGETVDLEVDYSVPNEIMWTYDGPSPNKWRGQLKITVNQPGIYQAFSKRARDERLTFRVLKRACDHGMYGAACNMTCNANCAAGRGICDDSDGTCICTPGFMGADCTTAVPAPIGFGIDGTLLCEKNGVTNPGCKGILFCRRDPFGCSCIKGFGGPRCTEVCPTGMYGSNCEFGP